MPARKAKKIKLSNSKRGVVESHNVPPASRSDLTDADSLQGSDTTSANGDQSTSLLSGNFEEDFITLCQQYDVAIIPFIVSRTQMSASMSGRPPPDMGKPLAAMVHGRKKSHGQTSKRSIQPPSRKVSPQHGHSSMKDQAAVLIKDGEVLDTVSSRADLTQERRQSNDVDVVKPTFPHRTVQVKFHHLSDTSRDLREIYIRGWPVDKAMMQVLKYCCVALTEHLTLLHLWKADLSASTMAILTAFLPRCRSLSTLQLDANPVGGLGCMGELVSEQSPLQHLSLRFCELTDMDALGLAAGLGTSKTWNKKLITLNLSHNQMTDVGASYLASGLMTNRTLLVLNLASNRIGDDGASAMAQVLSEFPLNQEQLTCRRWIFAEKENPILKIENEPSNQDLTEISKPTKRMSTIEKKKSRDPRKDKEQADKFPKANKVAKRGSYISVNMDPLTDFAKLGKKDSKMGMQRQQTNQEKGSKKGGAAHKKKVATVANKVEPGHNTPPREWHPLAEAARLGQDHQLHVLGNRSLFSLNLSRNFIKEPGLCQLLDMLHVQGSRGGRTVGEGQPELMQPPSYCSFTGLRRLVLHGNAVTPDNPVLQKIENTMRIRDPLYRMPILTLHRGNVTPCAMPPITV